MAYRVFGEFKSQLEDILNKKYKDKRVRVTKNEVVTKENVFRPYSNKRENVAHEGKCTNITVRPITSNYVSDNPYAIFITLIHNDLQQTKEWLQLNESKIEILD